MFPVSLCECVWCECAVVGCLDARVRAKYILMCAIIIIKTLRPYPQTQHSTDTSARVYTQHNTNTVTLHARVRQLL